MISNHKGYDVGDMTHIALSNCLCEDREYQVENDWFGEEGRRYATPPLTPCNFPLPYANPIL